MDKLTSTIILSLVEGLTEFLPISSTGHLILVSRLLGISSDTFLKVFEVFIQSGAICAVIIIYSRKLFLSIHLWHKLLVGFIPAIIIGLLFQKQIESKLLDNSNVVLGSLFIGGVFFLFWDRISANFKATASTLESITYSQAFFIGLAQTLAFVPGVSRAAATIMGGLMIGLSKGVAVEFSFLLAIPTLFAASALVVVSNNQNLNTIDWFYLMIGFLVSLFAAYFSIKVFIGYLKKHGFNVFGWYRIILAMLYALFVR